MVAYRLEFQCAIVFGGPVCPPDEAPKLTEAFHKFCRESDFNIIYIIVSEEFAKSIVNRDDRILIEVCEELILDLEQDPCLSSNRLRHRVEKAVKHGLTIHEYMPFDAEIENSLKQLGIKWQQAIRGPNIYLGHLDFFENYTGKRWFYAKDGEEITAMVMLSRIGRTGGWLLKFLIIAPDSFPSTSEFLMTSVLEILGNEKCRFLTKGMVPVDCLGEITGLGHFSKWFVKVLYQCISRIFRFKKRKEYWQRYNPTAIPSYLVFCGPSIGLNEIRALMKVFRTSRGSRQR